MKINTGLLFILFFCLFIPGLNAEEALFFPDPETTISMDFQDANLKDILKIFSIQSGLNFIASEAVQDRKITLYLNNISIKEAMDKLFKANNLTYELDPESNIFIVKDWGRLKPESITKIFYLKYASVSSSVLKKESGSSTEGIGITKAVEKLISEYGSVIEDSRTNSLIVTDIPSRMSIIAQTIASLDLPQPQVMLEVEMLDVSKNTVDALGFEFGTNPFTLVLPGSFAHRGAEFLIRGLNSAGTANIDKGASGSLTLGDTYAGLLDFLRTQTDTKYLARPRILTLNNETAEIKIATQESVGLKTTTTSTEGTGTTTAEAERVETGVTLRVTPQINTETGEITMFIYPKVSEAITGNTLTSGDLSYIYRDPEERSTKSTVRVKDGETIIVGGLIRNEFSQSVKKVPILGDIPILGAFFRHKDKTRDRDRELLVFITPRIIKDTTIPLAQAKKVVIPEREQTMVSDVSRQLSVNTYLNSFEGK